MIYDIIVHIGSDHINESVGLHNALLHYAELSDAAARHKFVHSIVTRGPRRDFLGKLFTLANEEQCA